MEEKEKKNPYGVFNPDTKKWDGAEQGIDAQDYIKRRQAYGGDEWATGKGKAKELHGSDYGDAKKEWLAQGKSEEGFSANYFAGGDEGTLGGRRHKANVDRGLRAQEDEKQWRAGQAAGYEKLGEKGQRTAGIQAGNNIKKDKELYSKVTGSRGDSYGVKDLFNKMTGGGGYGGTPNTLSGEERAKMVQGLEKLGVNPGSVFRDLQSGSPMKRNSPFKKLGEIRRHTYEDRSNLIGGKVEDVFEEKRAREKAAMEEDRQARQAEMQQLQLSQMKQAQYESLNVPADTGIKSADQYIQGASRQMVDAQAALVGSLKNGEIDTDQFAQKSALIKSQIPALAKTKETLTKFQTDYAELLKQGKLSGANDGQAGELYNLIQSGEMLIQPDEEGNMMMTNPDGSISVPLSQIDRIPKATPKAPEWSELVNPAIKSIGEGEWDPNAVKTQMDGMFSGNDAQDEKTLKAMGVDRLGLSLEDANEMLNRPGSSDEYQNALEEEVENRLVEEAERAYKGNRIKTQRQQQMLALQQQKMAAYERSVALQSEQQIAQQESDLIQRNQATAAGDQNNDVLNKLESGGFTADSIESALGVAVNEDGKFIQFKHGKETVTLPKDNPAAMKQILRKIMGAKASNSDYGLEYDDDGNLLDPSTNAPFKRNSPFKKDKPKETSYLDTAKSWGKKGLDFLGLLPKDTSDEALGTDIKNHVSEDGIAHLGDYQDARNKALGWDENRKGAANPFLGGPAKGVGAAAKLASSKSGKVVDKATDIYNKYADEGIILNMERSGAQAAQQAAKQAPKRTMTNIMDDMASRGMLGADKFEAEKIIKNMAKEAGVKDPQAIKNMLEKAKTARFNYDRASGGTRHLQADPELNRTFTNLSKYAVGGTVGALGAGTVYQGLQEKPKIWDEKKKKFVPNPKYKGDK